MTYGVVPTGFNRKGLAEIKASMETRLAAIWPGVQLDSSTPIGQIIGIISEPIAESWEVAEAVYSANDPSMAEGAALDTLGATRGIARLSGESDGDFFRRLSNTGVADIPLSDLENSVRSVGGVTWVRAYVNRGDVADERGVLSHSISVSVIGGSDVDVAQAIADNHTAGIGLTGNTSVEVTDGARCSTILFTRPAMIPLDVIVTINFNQSACGCYMPTNEQALAALQRAWSSACGAGNGDDVTVSRVSAAMADFAGVEVLSVRVGLEGQTLELAPYSLSLSEMADFKSVQVVS